MVALFFVQIVKHRQCSILQYKYINNNSFYLLLFYLLLLLSITNANQSILKNVNRREHIITNINRF